MDFEEIWLGSICAERMSKIIFCQKFKNSRKFTEFQSITSNKINEAENAEKFSIPFQNP